MEGKDVIMSVVLVSFLVVLGQIQVEAQQLRSCCPNATARGLYDVCRALPPRCATLTGCILVPGRMACPPDFPYNMLQNTVNEYCKSGCVSSVCAAISTLQDSDASEVVNGAVEECGNACSNFCTNKAASVTTTVVETTAAAA